MINSKAQQTIHTYYYNTCNDCIYLVEGTSVKILGLYSDQHFAPSQWSLDELVSDLNSAESQFQLIGEVCD